MNEQENPVTPALQDWLAIRDEHISRLEAELAAAGDAFHQKTKELNAIRQEHNNYVNAANQKTKALEAENHTWQSDYENLRIQKGGFGFKAILGTGAAATVVGLLIGWIIFRQKDPNSILFDQFNKSAGFKLEYTISQRQYPAAERVISEFNHNSAFQPLKPEFDLLMRLVNAARTATGDSSSTTTGYSVLKEETTNTASQPTRSLTITSDNGAPMYAEALTTAEVITLLKKKTVATQWDRTPEPEKVKVTVKGVKGVAEDYWYELETDTGHKGWVFGFHTNASLKKFKPDVPDSLAIKKENSIINKGTN